MYAFIRRSLYHYLHAYRKMSFTDTPIVVVLGSTGAGKSKLAIDMAEEFNGEIISADSMQVYKGLDIISNKVTAEEQAQVPHHMIDVVEPTTNYSVVKFRDACLSLIEELRGRGKLPVIVGGTNYYIEAVLWKLLVADRPEDSSDAEGDGCGSGSPTSADDVTDDGTSREPGDAERQRLERLSTEELYAQLRERDPAQAQVLHPNERRKILRSLEVTLRSGRPMSEHLRRQRAETGGGALGGPLRFPRACLLWVTADQQVLDRRLDARVDDMMSRGLLDELADFHRSYNTQRLRDGAEPDYTHGIFQSIGFKEFHGYLTRPETADTTEAALLLEEGVERLKLVTRRYARKQTRWVRRRFLSVAGGRQALPLYRLDATDPQHWEERVRLPAASVVRAWLDGRTPELAPEPLEGTNTGDKTTYHCSVCDVYTSGAQQRDEHLASRRHHRALQSRKRRTEREEMVDAKRAAVQADSTAGSESAEEGDAVGRLELGEVTSAPDKGTGEDEFATATLPTQESKVSGNAQGAA